MKHRIGICTLVVFVCGSCVPIPDLITKVVCSVIPAMLCAVLVWLSGVILLHLGRSERLVVIVSIFWTVLLSLLPYMWIYLPRFLWGN